MVPCRINRTFNATSVDLDTFICTCNDSFVVQTEEP